MNNTSDNYNGGFNGVYGASVINGTLYTITTFSTYSGSVSWDVRELKCAVCQRKVSIAETHADIIIQNKRTTIIICENCMKEHIPNLDKIVIANEL